MSSDDEFPDEFHGVNWDAIDIPALRETLISPHRPVSRPASASSHFLCDDDEIDAAFLAEVDALEERAAQAEATSRPDRSSSRLRSDISGAQATSSTASASSSAIQASRFFPGYSNPLPRASHAPPKCHQTIGAYGTSLPAQKRNALPSPLSSPSRKKGKMKSHEDTDHVLKILTEFEHEITCPICCDIFAAAHIGNPCGHSFCGECGWQWNSNNRIPTCAVCRSNLSTVSPMIPNFVVDNTVDKHVKALGLHGNMDWKPGGAKFLEWAARKDEWKRRAAARASGVSSRSRTSTTFNPPVFLSDDGWRFLDISDGLPLAVLDDDENDPDYVEVDDGRSTGQLRSRLRSFGRRDSGRSRGAGRSAAHTRSEAEGWRLGG